MRNSFVLSAERKQKRFSFAEWANFPNPAAPLFNLSPPPTLFGIQVFTSLIRSSRKSWCHAVLNRSFGVKGSKLIRKEASRVHHKTAFRLRDNSDWKESKRLQIDKSMFALWDNIWDDLCSQEPAQASAWPSWWSFSPKITTLGLMRCLQSLINYSFIESWSIGFARSFIRPVSEPATKPIWA